MSITKKIPIAIGIKPNQVATFTNKTMSGNNNIFTNLPNSALSFNSISINGTSIPLGGNINLSVAGGPAIVDTNTTYSVKASTIASGASLDLDASGSGSGTDLINFIGAGNVTVSRIDNSTIRISDAGNLGGVALTADNAATLTNKTISGITNTLSNISNASLVNSGITINNELVPLGGTVTIVGGGGSGGLTASGIDTLSNKTISALNNTITNIGNSSLVNSSISINGTAVPLGTNFTVSGLGDVTLTGTQDLSNKSLIAPILQDTKLLGTLRIGVAAGGNPGTTGQVLKSTGTGVQWATENQITAASLVVGSGLSSTGTGSFNGSNGITVSVDSSVVNTIPEWTLGVAGTNEHYTFTGPGFIGAVNDPILYLVRGQSYKFLNPMGAHPFQIRVGDGGNPYSTGIINNGFISGTLTWNVQFDAPNILYYQCTAHPNMLGTIYILDVAPSSPTRTTAAATTAGLANNAVGNITITAAKTYTLLKLQTSHAAWIRLYTSDASRTADNSRVQGVDPSPNSGVISEVIATGAETVLLTPGAIGWNNDTTPSSNVYVSVKNQSGSLATVTVTMTYLKLEG